MPPSYDKTLCYTPAMSPTVVAVDLGGTNTRAALFEQPGPRPTRQHKLSTQAEDGPDAVIGRIIEAVEAVLPATSDELRIAVGAPGPLDPDEGVVLKAPNLPGWKDIPLRARLQDHFDCPVSIGNDANLAALGEWRHGAGRGSDDVIYLTISTGVGGGVITGGRLLIGSRGLGAELGHILVEPGGPVCSCGRRGHLEAVASGTALARRAGNRLEAGEDSTLREVFESGNMTAEDVGDAARRSDRLALEVLEEAATHLGVALADFAHIFNPEVFVLGGGVSQLGPLLFEPAERALRENVMSPEYLQGLRLEPAALGDDAGLVGAMVLASGVD